MKKLLFVLFVVSPICAIDDAFGDLFGEKLTLVDHIREKRQHPPQQQAINYRPYSQAPPQIKEILASQLARDPIVHIPSQPPPQLASSQRQQPVYRTQAQVSQYNPQVKTGAPPQQPTYKQIPTGAAQYQQPQYRPTPAAAYPQQQQQQQPQYSSRLPADLQQLLRIQAGLPNSIPHGRQG